jgi:hypothetical protein
MIEAIVAIAVFSDDRPLFDRGVAMWRARVPAYFYMKTDGDTSTQAGGIVLALYPRLALAEDALTSPEGNGFSGITLAYNARSESEVDEIIRDLKAKGVKIIKEPQKVFWGGYSSYFADPDDYRWEVAYNPFSSFDESGNLKLE